MLLSFCPLRHYFHERQCYEKELFLSHLYYCINFGPQDLLFEEAQLFEENFEVALVVHLLLLDKRNE